MIITSLRLGRAENQDPGIVRYLITFQTRSKYLIRKKYLPLLTLSPPYWEIANIFYQNDDAGQNRGLF